MITMLYSLGRIVGAAIALFGYALCTLFYFGLCFLFQQNRKAGKKRVLLGWVISEVFFDTILLCCYYPNWIYVNYGIGGMAVCLIWPILLFFAGLFATALNEQ